MMNMTEKEETNSVEKGLNPTQEEKADEMTGVGRTGLTGVAEAGEIIEDLLAIATVLLDMKCHRLSKECDLNGMKEDLYLTKDLFIPTLTILLGLMSQHMLLPQELLLRPHLPLRRKISKHNRPCFR